MRTGPHPSGSACHLPPKWGKETYRLNTPTSSRHVVANTTANPTTSGPGQDPNTVNNVGTSYTFEVETTASAWALKTNGTDKFIGSMMMVDTDSSGAVTAFAPASSNDVINFNGTTTGGIAGSTVTVTVLAANKYMVTGVALASGSVVTPFADA